MSGSVQVVAVDGSRILDYPAIRRALLGVYADAELSDVVTTPEPFPQSSIQVTPASAPPFAVALDDDGSGCSIDGLPEQSAPIIVALRAAIPADAGRIIALDTMSAEQFAELPFGITVEQLGAAWRPLDEFDESATE